MRYLRIYAYIVITAFITAGLCSGPASYADDARHWKIRKMSIKQNEQLFDGLAIQLLNGNSRFVSLDDMVQILKDYDIVDFRSQDAEDVKDIVLNEVAFRMLKQNYLPRVDDRIKVYKSQQAFASETGVYDKGPDLLQTDIILPMDSATVKDAQQLKTLYWSSMVNQVTSVVEKLWLRRIGYSAYTSGDEIEAVLEAAQMLRKKFIQRQDISDYKPQNSSSSAILQVAQDKIGSWLTENQIRVSDLPVLTEMFIQYMMHTHPAEVVILCRDIQALNTIDELCTAINLKIGNTSELVRRSSPSDYGVLAMLQGLLNEISNRFLLFASKPGNDTRARNIQLQQSRYSA